MPKSKWYKNLEDKNVNRWYESIRKKSKVKADVYLRPASSFSEYYEDGSLEVCLSSKTEDGGHYE